MQDLGKRTFHFFQLFFGMDVAVARGDVVHIGNQHQPALFRFAIVQRVFGIFLFDDFQDFIRMQLIKQRQLILQKQKNAFLMGRSSNMLYEFCSFVIGNGR